MKYKIPAFVILVLLSKLCQGQYGEFKVYPNGLMYSEKTMNQLEHIVDSLNLKFKTCDLTTYYSKYQAKAHYISLAGKDVKSAKNDMDNNMEFQQFISKYRKAVVDTNLLVVKYKYKNYDEADEIEFSTLPSNHEISFVNQPEYYTKPVKGKWVYEYTAKNKYSDESIRAYFFVTEFESFPLTEKYARMVQYSDCMVDTTAEIFKENAKRINRWEINNDSIKRIGDFMNYVGIQTGEPVYSSDEDTTYWKNYYIWDSLRFSRIDSTLVHQDKFVNMLKEAVDEALTKGGSSDEFEEYVARYYSPKTALELKRSRIVIGGCSMDDSPRRHAMNIAVLSAETVNWEIFLRAHLNIMNDRFERVSDGSWAWKGRKTYIRELEELDINVSDLLIGICLRIENPSKNHYYGSISRIGRSLSESKFATEIESKMVEMIKDDQLDDYNRLLIFYLFKNYNYYLTDKNKQQENEKLIGILRSELPEYLSAKLKDKED